MGTCNAITRSVPILTSTNDNVMRSDVTTIKYVSDVTDHYNRSLHTVRGGVRVPYTR